MNSSSGSGTAFVVLGPLMSRTDGYSAGHAPVRQLALLNAGLMAVLLVTVFASTALAAGSISGQITDSVTHAGIAGSKVWIFDLNSVIDTPIIATADGSGNYS